MCARALTITSVADDHTQRRLAVSARGSHGHQHRKRPWDPDIAAEPGRLGVNDTINFNINAAGLQTINVAPSAIKPVTIDGYTRGGLSQHWPMPTTPRSSSRPNGTGAGGMATNGLTPRHRRAGSTIRGLAINRFQADASFNGGNGILVLSDGNSIVGNFIGTNAGGYHATQRRRRHPHPGRLH